MGILYTQSGIANHKNVGAQMTTKSVGGLSTPQKVRDALEKCIAFYEGVLVLKHEEKNGKHAFPIQASLAFLYTMKFISNL